MLGPVAVAAGQHDAELVAAEPGDGVALAQHGAQPLAHTLDQQVAVEVPEVVVDLLEAVEVHQHHRHLAIARAGAEGVLEHPVEERPVGQPGERVVLGLVLLLHGLPLEPRGRAADDAEERDVEDPEAREEDREQGARVAGDVVGDRVVGEGELHRSLALSARAGAQRGDYPQDLALL